MSISKFFAKSTAISKSGGAKSAAVGRLAFQDPALPQVEKKLRKLERYKNMTGSELKYEVEKLSTIEELLNEFSHIVDHTIISGDGACQASTALQIASIHIQIMVRDDSPGAQLAVTRSMAEFMRMNYDKKQVVLKLNDVVLVWGGQDLVIPQRVEEYEALPGLLPVVETVEYFFYCTSVSEDSPIFGGVAKVISKYNKTYYSSGKRNSQKFVCEVLEALGILAKTCSSLEVSERMLQLKEKKSGDVPDGFARHEDVDAFIRSKSKSWLAHLQTESLEYLQLVYMEQFHSEKTVCPVPNCRLFALSELLQQRLMLS